MWYKCKRRLTVAITALAEWAYLSLRQWMEIHGAKNGKFSVVSVIFSHYFRCQISICRRMRLIRYAFLAKQMLQWDLPEIFFVSSCKAWSFSCIYVVNELKHPNNMNKELKHADYTVLRLTGNRRMKPERRFTRLNSCSFCSVPSKRIPKLVQVGSTDHGREGVKLEIVRLLGLLAFSQFMASFWDENTKATSSFKLQLWGFKLHWSKSISWFSNP